MIELLETPSFSVAEVGNLMRKIDVLFLFLLLPKLLFAQAAPVLPARSLVFSQPVRLVCGIYTIDCSAITSEYVGIFHRFIRNDLAA